jgi:hypothetical protein
MRMKQLWTLAAVVVVGFGFYAMGADDNDEHRPPAPPPPPREREMGLHQQMENMGRLFKKLKSQVADSSKNQSSLDLVLQMEQATLAAKSQAPPMVARMPATQQAEGRNDYRQMMVTLFRQELDLEEQLINGDNKTAAETVAAMDKTQDDGHKEFRPKRQGRGD